MKYLYWLHTRILFYLLQALLTTVSAQTSSPVISFSADGFSPALTNSASRPNIVDRELRFNGVGLTSSTCQYLASPTVNTTFTTTGVTFFIMFKFDGPSPFYNEHLFHYRGSYHFKLHRYGRLNKLIVTGTRALWQQVYLLYPFEMNQVYRLALVYMPGGVGFDQLTVWVNGVQVQVITLPNK
jgi:hypothetical protein